MKCSSSSFHTFLVIATFIVLSSLFMPLLLLTKYKCELLLCPLVKGGSHADKKVKIFFSQISLQIEPILYLGHINVNNELTGANDGNFFSNFFFK